MLIEDNQEYREGISLILQHTSDIDLISQFGTAEVALRDLQSGGPKIPDLILLDLRLPGMDGLEALPYLHTYSPDSKVMILTQSDDQNDVLNAIKTGASGYLTKTATAQEIIEGIRIVMDGGAMLDPKIAGFIMSTLKSRLPHEEPERNLSKREFEVLKLLAEGFVKKEIAHQLDIQYSTVDYHVGRIYEKLNVRNAPAAVNMGHKMGLLSPEDDA